MVVVIITEGVEVVIESLGDTVNSLDDVTSLQFFVPSGTNT